MSLLIATINDTGSIKSFTASDWNRLVNEARAAEMLGKLYYLLQNNNLLKHVPNYAFNHLSSAWIQANNQKVQTLWESNNLKKAIDSLNIPIILLKGAAYLYENLDAGKGRTLNDIDILAPKPQLKKIESALFVNGWFGKEIDDYDEKYYREWCHEIPPLVHSKRGTVVDLHHNIFPVLRNLNPPADKLFEKAIFQTDTNIGVLDLYDMISHSATHLFWEGEFDKGLRDLSDLTQLFSDLAQSPTHNFEGLATRAAELGLIEPVFYAARYCKAIFNTNIPENFFDYLLKHNDKTSITRRIPQGTKLVIMDWLFLSVLKPHHSCSSKSTDKWARLLLFIRGHLIKMPLSILLPHLTKKMIKSLKETKDKTKHEL